MNTATTLAPPGFTDEDERPNPNMPFRRALNAVLMAGIDLLERITAAITLKTTKYIPTKCAKNPEAAQIRATRALGWLVALSRVMAGDRYYLPTTLPTGPSGPRGPCAFPHIGERAPMSDSPSLASIRRAFATRPIGRIMAHICRDLAIRKSSDPFPADLATFTQTPAAWHAENHARPAPRPAPPAPTPSPTPLPAITPAPHPGAARKPAPD